MTDEVERLYIYKEDSTEWLRFVAAANKHEAIKAFGAGTAYEDVMRTKDSHVEPFVMAEPGIVWRRFWRAPMTDPECYEREEEE